MLKRDLERFSNKLFDVLVVGGGIYGAIAAWDAALRGLSVGLIERGDFGSATSQNSLKVIHGGLRYLQDANLMRYRTMARERTTWMKIAPHLVHPLRCITPTLPKLSRSRLVMGVALKLNDILSYDRNRLSDPGKYLAGGRILSKKETAQALPGLDISGFTGAAIWHDAQMFNSERLLLSFVLSAAQAGAVVANYVEATGFMHQGDSVSGVQVKDIFTGQEFAIRSKVIINCTGAWVDKLLATLGKPDTRPLFNTSIALNLIVPQIWADVAAGLPSRPARNQDPHDLKRKRRSQIFFIVPWRGKSIIGTWHIPWDRSPDAFQVSEDLIQDFVNEVNSAHPGLGLSLQDVEHVHWGFLPMERSSRQREQVNLTRESVVIDHSEDDGLAGLISVLGVKYTTARAIAEKAVDLAVKKLGMAGVDSQTHSTPVSGGSIEQFQDYLNKAQAQASNGIDPEIIEHLVYTYGSDYKNLLDYIAEQPALGKRVDENLPVIQAEVVYAVRQEMAHTLGDIICRRTELGAAGLPALSVLQVCSDLIGRELGWDNARRSSEIETLINAYPFKHLERALT
jgi:glycerol-3-phosphate dehydrogenase